jgi:hypothetical protein
MSSLQIKIQNGAVMLIVIEIMRTILREANMNGLCSCPLILTDLPLPGFRPSHHGCWVHLLHADEKGVNEVPRGIGIQGVLVLLHLLSYEFLQPL